KPWVTFRPSAEERRAGDLCCDGSRTLLSLSNPNKRTHSTRRNRVALGLRSYSSLTLSPGERKVHVTAGTMIQFSEEQKREAVIAFCTRTGSAERIASEFGISSRILYKWKRQLLDQESDVGMGQTPPTELPSDRDGLAAELESLKRQKYALQMEIDILNKAAEE